MMMMMMMTYLVMPKRKTSLILSKKPVFVSNFNVFTLMFVIFFLF